MRLQVSKAIEGRPKFQLKKIEYVRVPLRLGREVFETGRIGKKQQAKFIKALETFKSLMDLYEVDEYMACATSAMREASNGKEVASEVKAQIGLEIDIIDGSREAGIVHTALEDLIDIDTYLHMDVGGGSTELILYENGNQLMSGSFAIGSVRRLLKKDKRETWEELEQWTRDHVRKFMQRPVAIGTGGNISKLFDLAEKKDGEELGLLELKEISASLASVKPKQRERIFNLHPDRADVIVPASEIYISVMEWSATPHILVPDAGLKDGMLKLLVKKHLTLEE